jgi:uncharacterized protein (TIGR03067 family)
MNRASACFAALTLALLGVAGARDDDAAKKELEAFTGTWRAVSATKDGKEAPRERAEKISLVVKGEKYTFTGSDGVAIEGTHKVNPSKSPKEIEAVRSSGEGKGEKILGIYELTKDTYKVCLAPPGKPRPKEFASKEGTGHRLLEFKRARD